MDQVTMGAAFAGPGQDTRQWVSYGIVAPGNESVIFTDDTGNVLPTGPLVIVNLEPSGITVPCRVSAATAGNQEGEWLPFLPGDEVLVVIPEGDERAGCVIIGRLNQDIDKFPLLVAGQDVTKNNFGFKRLRTPYIIETASSFMIRSAITGAGITIDPTGNCFFNSGDGHQLVMHASFMKFADKSGDNFLQVDPSASEVLLQAAGTTQLNLGKSASSFFTMGTFDIGTGGAAGGGHAVTAEQVFAILANFCVFLNTSGGVASLSGILASASAFDAVYSAWIQQMSVPLSPFLPVPGAPAPGSLFVQCPLTFSPIGAINTGMLELSLIPPDPTGAAPMPGIGRPNLTF